MIYVTKDSEEKDHDLPSYDPNLLQNLQSRLLLEEVNLENCLTNLERLEEYSQELAKEFILMEEEIEERRWCHKFCIREGIPAKKEEEAEGNDFETKILDYSINSDPEDHALHFDDQR